MKEELHNTFQVGEIPLDQLPILKSLLENTKVAGILILNKEGIILQINPGAFLTFGYTEEDVVGKNYSMLFTKEDREKKLYETELADVLSTGAANDNNFILHKSGKKIPCHGESILAVDKNNKVIIVKIVYDISKQLELETNLRKSNKELQKINKDLDTFVYSASHDLKAPIKNIESLIEILKQEECCSKVCPEIVDMLTVSCLKFEKVLNELSEIGKIKHSEEETMECISFSEVMETIKYSIHDLIQKENATILEDFSKAPDIRVSKKNLNSLLQNLISNAIKYRSPDRVPIVEVSSEPTPSGFILLKVQDNGLGMKEEDKGKIFSIYQRVHFHVEGTGVGMNIVRRIIDNNGGWIEVESELGKGSLFKVYINNKGL